MRPSSVSGSGAAHAIGKMEQESKMAAVTEGPFMAYVGSMSMVDGCRDEVRTRRPAA